jgi:hypothetical protein
MKLQRPLRGNTNEVDKKTQGLTLDVKCELSHVTCQI